MLIHLDLCLFTRVPLLSANVLNGKFSISLSTISDPSSSVYFSQPSLFKISEQFGFLLSFDFNSKKAFSIGGIEEPCFASFAVVFDLPDMLSPRSVLLRRSNHSYCSKALPALKIWKTRSFRVGPPLNIHDRTMRPSVSSKIICSISDSPRSRFAKLSYASRSL